MRGCLAGPLRRTFSSPACRTRSTSTGVDEFGVSEPALTERVHPAAEAVRTGILAISFSGGGFLLPYFLGAAEVLQQVGLLTPSTPLAGSSSGSLVAAGLACGLTPTQLLDSFQVSVEDCRKHGSYKRLEEVVGRQLQATLPPDAAARCSTGRLTVGVTKVFPHLHTKRVCAFTDRQDLLDCLMASCHIPRYFNGDFTRNFRGRVVVDGGMTALLPEPTAPHGFLLKVCCFPRKHVAKLPVLNRKQALHQLSYGITPDAFGPWPYTLQQMLAAALHPHTDEFISKLHEAGRTDALRWAEAVGVTVPAAEVAAAAAAAAHAPVEGPPATVAEAERMGEGVAGEVPAVAVAEVVAGMREEDLEKAVEAGVEVEVLVGEGGARGGAGQEGSSGEDDGWGEAGKRGEEGVAQQAGPEKSA